MAKQKIYFICSKCDSQHLKWQGQCSECGEWNTLTEQKLTTAINGKETFAGFAGQIGEDCLLKNVVIEETARIETGIAEFDRVLGGGLVYGSASLLVGSPGAGKSTILLQIACYLALKHQVLYVSGEESLQQIAMRAKRLGISDRHLRLVTETDVNNISKLALQHKPEMLIIDSIQTMSHAETAGTPGGISQVRQCATYLTQLAKQSGIIILFIGHVTKDGTLAGPKVLEHCIDCSISLESTEDSRFRIMRARKNRFGSVNELGIFSMTEKGLKPVKNPSAIFLSGQKKYNFPGSVVTVLWKGSRALLIEIQSLVSTSQSNDMRRVALGLDQLRLSMLLAIINHYSDISFINKDIFVNVVGGVKIDETAVDLAVILSLVSSLENKALKKGILVLGELGLSGEIRPVPNGEARIKEAVKHGFTKAIVPYANLPRDVNSIRIELFGVEKLQEALKILKLQLLN